MAEYLGCRVIDGHFYGVPLAALVLAICLASVVVMPLIVLARARQTVHAFAAQPTEELADEDAVTAIEVKGGRVKPTTGMSCFVVENPPARALVVGSYECDLESFLLGEHELLW